MSDLSDLAADVTKDLPIGVRKVIDAALANGWELNKPGMTVALRLNHPTDELAQPVFITWYVGRTPKGALSFKFSSCATQGLIPLSGADLLEYLADPTVIYPTHEEAAKAEAEYDDSEWEKRTPKWDANATPVQNVVNQLHGQMIGLENTTAADLMREQRARLLAPPSDGPSQDAKSPQDSGQASGNSAPPIAMQSARPLRIQAPKV